MLLVIVIVSSPVGSVVADHAAAAHANAIVASTPTISCSQTAAATGAELIGVGVAVCHARVHALTPRCCNSASPSRELPGAPTSAPSRSCS
jgi:hypothetical protein